MSTISSVLENNHRQDNIKAILFDLDGTLLDSAEGILASLDFILNKYQLPNIDRSKLYQFLGQGMTALIRYCAPKLDDKSRAAFAQEGIAHYCQNALRITQAYPDAEDTLKYLSLKKIPWGIVTNKTRKLVQAVIDVLPYYENCKVLICSDDLKYKKPHPEPLLHAAKVLNINPNNIAYIGDAITDMQAAKSAKMIAVLALYGYLPLDISDWVYDKEIATLLNIKDIL